MAIMFVAVRRVHGQRVVAGVTPKFEAVITVHVHQREWGRRDSIGLLSNPDPNYFPSVARALGKREGPLRSVVVTIGVDDIDAALIKIEQLGGKTVQKKMPVGDTGFAEYFKNTEATS